MNRENLLIATSAIIVSGKTITLICNDNEVVDGKFLCLKLLLTGQDLENFNTELTGTEVVSIQLGVSATAPTFVAENKIGDILYSDRLINEKCYRIVFGNNGAISPTDGGLGHFLFIDMPGKRCAKPYNAANVANIEP